MIHLIEFDRSEHAQQIIRAQFNGIPWAIGFSPWLDPLPECPEFWLGREYYDIPQSELLDISREELWKLLNDPECGLERYHYNLTRKGRRESRRIPGKGVDSRVCALIRAALGVRNGCAIGLIYEPGDRSQAEMIVRCIEWLASFIESPY